MADENEPGPFDVPTIRLLVALMSRHDISEIDLREGNRRVRLLRGAPPPVAVAAPVAATRYSGAASRAGLPRLPLRRPRNRLANSLKSRASWSALSTAAANPDAEPYVKVGSRVTPTTVVGLVEAMKLYNDLQAGCPASSPRSWWRTSSRSSTTRFCSASIPRQRVSRI